MRIVKALNPGLLTPEPNPEGPVSKAKKRSRQQRASGDFDTNDQAAGWAGIRRDSPPLACGRWQAKSVRSRHRSARGDAVIRKRSSVISA